MEVATRSVIQIRTHAQKFFIKVAKVAPCGVDLVEFVQSRPLSYFVGMDDSDPGSEEEKQQTPDSESQAEGENGPMHDPSGEDGLRPERSRKRKKYSGDSYVFRRQDRGEAEQNREEVKSPAAEAPQPQNPEEAKLVVPPAVVPYNMAGTQQTMGNSAETVEEALNKAEMSLDFITSSIQTYIGARKAAIDSSPVWSGYWNYLYNTAAALQRLVRETSLVHYGGYYTDPRMGMGMAQGTYGPMVPDQSLGRVNFA